MTASHLPAQYQTRYVLFSDVLGFRAIINKIETDGAAGRELLNKIEQISMSVQGDVARINATSNMRVVATMFSDCLVISASNDANGLKFLLYFILFLQMRLMSEGIFARGAIAKGLLWHDGPHLLGSGLNNAYDLESKFAIYPRIIISKEVHEDIKSISDALEKKLLNEICPRDADGFYFISPFYPPSAPGPDATGLHYAEDHLRKVQEHIRNAIAENVNKLDIYSKYFWLARQLDEILAVWHEKGELKAIGNILDR